MSVIFGELPPDARTNGRRGDGVLGNMAAELRANPGRWGRVDREYVDSSVITYPKKRHPDITWAIRKQPNGKFHLWGCYQPDGAA